MIFCLALRICCFSDMKRHIYLRDLLYSICVKAYLLGFVPGGGGV